MCSLSGYRYRRFTLIWLISSWCCYILSGQNGYYTAQYTSRDGLPQNSIRGLTFDKNGFLWAATEGGIARFDGRRFRVMGSNDHPLLKNQRFSHALPCRDGSILFIDHLNGMYLLSDNRFTNLQTPDVKNPDFSHIFGSLPDASVIIKDSFFMNENHRVSVLYQPGEHILPIDDSHVVMTSNRVVILDTRTRQLRIIKPSVTLGDKFGQLKEVALWIDAQDNLWMLSQADQSFMPCQLVDDTGRKWTGSFKDAFLFSQYPANELFVSTGQKLYTIVAGKSKGQYIIRLVLENLPENCTIKAVAYREVEDVLVLGTDSKGIFVYQNKPFDKILRDDEETLVKNSFYAQVLPDSETFVASNGLIADINSFNRKGSLPYPINNYLLCTDTHGDIFFTQGKNILRYQYRSGTSHRIKIGQDFSTLSMNNINDTIWIGTTRGVGQIRNDSVIWIHKFSFRGVRHGIKCLDIDMEGNLWFGSFLRMYRLSRSTGQLDSFPMLADADNRVIAVIRNILFIGTYGNGYYVYDKGRLVRMPDGRNQELANTHTFAEDEDGYLWISTNRGLFKTHMDAVEAYLADTTIQLDYYVYLEEDGIPNQEFNGGCSPPHLWLPDGRLSLPSLEGFIIFHPGEVPHFFPKDTLLIESIEVDGMRYLPEAIHAIPANHANITVYFAGAWWKRPYNQYVYIRQDESGGPYRRIGMDQTSFSIGHLKPGKHTFVIRRRCGFGPEDYVYSRYHFLVKKPWYALGWAIVLFGLCIALITWVTSAWYSRSVRLRNIELQRKVDAQTRELLASNLHLEENVSKLAETEIQLRKNIKVRDRLISIITHDILTPLRFIGQIARLGTEEKPKEEGLTRRALTDVQNAVHKLFHSTQNLLHWVSFQQEQFSVSYTNCSPFVIVEQLITDLSEMAKFQGNTLHNEMPEDDVILSDPNMLHIVIHNLLSNAIKFTHEGDIYVRSSVEHDWYVLDVMDTGRGMSRAQLDTARKGSSRNTESAINNVSAGNGIGLSLVSDLVHALKGRWEIDSPEGKGVRVRIFLSLDQPNVV